MPQSAPIGFWDWLGSVGQAGIGQPQEEDPMATSNELAAYLYPANPNAGKSYGPPEDELISDKVLGALGSGAKSAWDLYRYYAPGGHHEKSAGLQKTRADRERRIREENERIMPPPPPPPPPPGLEDPMATSGGPGDAAVHPGFKRPDVGTFPYELPSWLTPEATEAVAPLAGGVPDPYGGWGDSPPAAPPPNTTVAPAPSDIPGTTSPVDGGGAPGPTTSAGVDSSGLKLPEFSYPEALSTSRGGDNSSLNMALMAAGLGMIGHRDEYGRPDPWGAIRTGGLAGLGVYQKEVENRRKEARQALQDEILREEAKRKYGLDVSKEGRASEKHAMDMEKLELEIEEKRREATLAETPEASAAATGQVGTLASIQRLMAQGSATQKGIAAISYELYQRNPMMPFEELYEKARELAKPGAKDDLLGYEEEPTAAPPPLTPEMIEKMRTDYGL